MKPTSEEIKHGVSKKKFSKPLMERRRRARINESLNELKSLVLSSLNKDHSKFSKMEKADVLELTVSYLKSLKSNSVQQTTDVEEQNQHFAAGYSECAREVQMYLLRSNDVTPHVKARMLSHIATSPPDMTSSKLSVSYPMKVEEVAFKPKAVIPTSFSLYPSPPASPTALGHVSMNLKSTSQTPWTQLCAIRDNRLEHTYERKDDQTSNHFSQELWRPWQNV